MADRSPFRDFWASARSLSPLDTAASRAFARRSVRFAVSICDATCARVASSSLVRSEISPSRFESAALSASVSVAASFSRFRIASSSTRWSDSSSRPFACDRALEVPLGPVQLDTLSPDLVSQLGKIHLFFGGFRDELLGLARARLKSRLVRLDGRLPLHERRLARFQVCGHRSGFLAGLLDLPFPAFEFASQSREFVSRFGLAPFLSRQGGRLRIELLFLFRHGRPELLELPFAPREPFLRGGRSRFHALVSLSEFPRACREGLRLLFVLRLRLQDLLLPADQIPLSPLEDLRRRVYVSL